MMGVPEEAKIFIVEFPVMAPTCQVPNGITILHEGWRLMREMLSVNSNKYVKTTT